MSETPEKPNFLSAFDLGPAWAREATPAKKNYQDHRGDEGDRGRQGGGARRSTGARGGDDRFGGGRRDGGFRQGGGRPAGGRGAPMLRDLPQPAKGVKVTVMPDPEAVRKVVKEIHHVARVYSLFDISKLLLGAKERLRLEIRAGETAKPLIRGKGFDALFLTREEAAAFFWQAGPVHDFYEVDEVETEAPSGNFQVVARCGLSGEWLGPPNFHAYQSELRRLHRERFSQMSFEAYSARVKTERGEEAVNAWLETMKVRRRWRPKGGDDDSWSFDRGVMERDLLTRCFNDVFEETRLADLRGDAPEESFSPGIWAAIRIAGGHARRHPAMLIPIICRMLESEHLAVFKKQGKLFTGPARPHPLSAGAVLSERPAAIVSWLEEHPDGKLIDLWKAVLPEGAEEAPKEWLVDMFWLLTQGHVLLFSDDSLVLPRRRHDAVETPASKADAVKKKRKRKKKKRKLFKARRPSHARQIRRIAMMNSGMIKKLRGPARIWARRLAKRERIGVLVAD